MEGLGLDGADELVDRGGERGAGFGGADGNRDREVGRADALQREHGDAEAVAGGEAVVDEDDRAVGEIGRRSGAAVESFAAAEFGGFAGDDAGDDGFGDAFGGDEGIVEQLNAAARDGANGEFGIRGMADFANEKNVERKIEGAGDFGGDRNASARKSEHECVLVNVRSEMAGKRLAGFAAVAVAVDGSHDCGRDSRGGRRVRKDGVGETTKSGVRGGTGARWAPRLH